MATMIRTFMAVTLDWALGSAMGVILLVSAIGLLILTSVLGGRQTAAP
jgi:ABC-type spermidine/putrescine transport system permease subunit I